MQPGSITQCPADGSTEQLYRLVFRVFYSIPATYRLIDKIKNSSEDFDYIFQTKRKNTIKCHIRYTNEYKIFINNDEIYINVIKGQPLYNFQYIFNPKVHEIFYKREFPPIDTSHIILNYEINDETSKFLRNILNGNFENTLLNTLSSEIDYLFHNSERSMKCIKIFYSSETYKKYKKAEDLYIQFNENIMNNEKYKKYFNNDNYDFMFFLNITQIIRQHLDNIFKKILLMINDYLMKNEREEVY